MKLLGGGSGNFDTFIILISTVKLFSKKSEVVHAPSTPTETLVLETSVCRFLCGRFATPSGTYPRE